MSNIISTCIPHLRRELPYPAWGDIKDCISWNAFPVWKMFQNQRGVHDGSIGTDLCRRLVSWIGASNSAVLPQNFVLDSWQNVSLKGMCTDLHCCRVLTVLRILPPRECFSRRTLLSESTLKEDFLPFVSHILPASQDKHATAVCPWFLPVYFVNCSSPCLHRTSWFRRSLSPEAITTTIRVYA